MIELRIRARFDRFMLFLLIVLTILQPIPNFEKQPLSELSNTPTTKESETFSVAAKKVSAELAQYQEHDPIVIDGDANFSVTAALEGWPGSGTKANPYIISSYNITPSSKHPYPYKIIAIANTDVYFQISNCLLDGSDGIGYSGIALSNVTHAQITDNIVSNMSFGYPAPGFGINMWESSDIFLFNNTLTNCANGGIGLLNSMNITIIENTIVEKWPRDPNRGVRLFDSPNNRIINNKFINCSLLIKGESVESMLQKEVINNSVNGKDLIYWQNRKGSTIPVNTGQVILINCSSVDIVGQNFTCSTFPIYIAFCSGIDILINHFAYCYGIIISYSTSNILISANDIRNCFIGIYIPSKYDYGGGTSSSIEISNTSFVSNRWAIRINDAKLGKISGNVFQYNEREGVFLESQSEYFTITINSFIGNNIGGCQASDDGSNNVFMYNYWNDWTSPDDNADSIVDEAYSISGFSNNQDLSPLTSPTALITHLLCDPTIVFPNGGEVLNETITVFWRATIDSLGHPITYSVYYSSDGGNTWVLLASNISGTAYVWNTSSLAIGSNYMVKVVTKCSEGLIAEDSSDSTFTLLNIYPTTSSSLTTTTTSGLSSTPGLSIIIVFLTILIILRIKRFDN
ncbi:MAG: nitrous oxide reductase family maturation protein NosD [Candidatus Hodarchaeota archaeon]